MRLIVTRPGEDGESLAQRLRGQGHDALCAPMLTLTFIPGPPPDLAGAQAILATSANGVRAFAARSTERDLPILAVGDATARAATVAGFTHVVTAGGDVETLARLVAETREPTDGRLIHVAGSTVAGDLSGLLQAAGFRVDRLVLYQADKCTELPSDITTDLQSGAVDGVLFYSPRTAKAFVDALDGAGLGEKKADLDAYCLSDAVAKAAKGGWRTCRIAARPDQDSLLALING